MSLSPHNYILPVSQSFVITRTEEGSLINLAQHCCGCCIYKEAQQVKLRILAGAWVYLHSLLCFLSGQKSTGFCVSQGPGKENHLLMESDSPDHGIDCWYRSFDSLVRVTWAVLMEYMEYQFD